MKIFLSLILTTIFVFPNTTDINQEIANLNLSSQNYILYSVDSDSLLAYENHTERISAASINKVLTTITALDLLGDESLDTMTTVDPQIFESINPIASMAYLVPNQKISIKEILYGIMMPSGADATALMSLQLTGSVDGLVKEMNLKAQAIGMEHTQIKNTSGLDQNGQYTTLEDLLTLLKYALQNPDFVDIFTHVEHTYSGNPYVTIQNYILKQRDHIQNDKIMGAKSGFTTIAQYSLASVSQYNDIEYIFISTNATGDDWTRQNGAFDDAVKVYDYLYETFYAKEIYQANSLEKKIDIKRRFSHYVYQYDQDIDVLATQAFNPENIRHNFVLEDNNKAPLEKGAKLGVHQIYHGDDLIFEQDILAQDAISNGIIYPAFFIILILTLVFFITRHLYRLHKIKKRSQSYRI